MTKETKKKVVFFLVTKFAWLLILLFGRLGRIRIIDKCHFDDAIADGKKALFTLWHGRMLLPIYVHRNMGINAMVSEHDDGEMIAQTVQKLGYHTVRGSSTRGGSRAFRQMLKAFQAKRWATILPDGPNGPACEFKAGAVMLAQLSGALIVPVCFSAEKKIVMKSWDKFVLWKPFSRLLLFYGQPIKIPRTMSASELESMRLHIQNRMNALQKRADEFFR
jgi:lysophospholipid acyltransferase (LPLAT)-like uncharacterized protein